MGVYQTKDGRYYVYYRFQGKQRKEYFGKDASAKQAAEERALRIQLLKKQGKSVLADFLENEKTQIEEAARKEEGKLYFDDLCQLYLDEAKRNRRSLRWLHDITNLLNNYILPAYQNSGLLPVEELSYLSVVPWFDFTNARSPATRNRYMAYVKSIFRFGVTQNLTSCNPLSGWRKAKEQKTKLILSLNDLQKIYEHAEPHLKWALTVEWELGARPGATELLALEWKHVLWDRNIIIVPGTKSHSSHREVPITQNFKQKLLEVKTRGFPAGVDKNKVPKFEKSDTHIISYKGKPVRKLRRSLQTACRKAGIQYRVRMYDLRHLTLSSMLARGGDLKAVSEIAGHSNVQTTAKVYSHVLEGQKRRVVESKDTPFN